MNVVHSAGVIHGDIDAGAVYGTTFIPGIEIEETGLVGLLKNGIELLAGDGEERRIFGGTIYIAQEVASGSVEVNEKFLVVAGGSTGAGVDEYYRLGECCK